MQHCTKSQSGPKNRSSYLLQWIVDHYTKVGTIFWADYLWVLAHTICLFRAFYFSIPLDPQASNSKATIYLYAFKDHITLDFKLLFRVLMVILLFVEMVYSWSYHLFGLRMHNLLCLPLPYTWLVICLFDIQYLNKLLYIIF